jgi:hypothetical protein
MAVALNERDSPKHPDETGRVRVTVRSSSGDPVARCPIKITALTPTEVRDIAHYTGPQGVLQVGLYPGRYILSAHGRTTSGRAMSGETPELDVVARQTVESEIVLLAPET